MKKAITILGLAMLAACTPTKRAYKITFKSGAVEYYELDYKLKRGATSIEYNGETIIGVADFEEIK